MRSIIVVMGVSGSGKSTVGKLVADQLGFEFAEGDEFHPQANVAKMSSGQPLTDEDRWPWLRQIAEWIDRCASEHRGGVVTCSALKRSYRRILDATSPQVWFAQLDAPRAVIGERLMKRSDHFMPAGLLQSQYDALEPLTAGESGMRIDIAQSPKCAAEDIISLITKRDGSAS